MNVAMMVKRDRHVKPTIPIQALIFPKIPPRSMTREMQSAARPLKNRGMNEPAVKSSPRANTASLAAINIVLCVSVLAAAYLLERTSRGMAALLDMYIDMAVIKMTIVNAAPSAFFS